MRVPADLPKRSRRAIRGRIVIVALIVLFLLITSLRSIASFYTDYLWFKELKFTSVFRGVLVVQVLLAVVFCVLFFAIMLGNLIIADRIAPRFRPTGPEDELVQRYREAVGPHANKVRIVVAAGLRPLRRHRHPLAVEQLDPVPPRHLVPHQGPAVRPGRGLLRLPAAVHQVLHRLAVRRHRDHAGRDRRVPLPERRHPGAVARAAGDAPGEGPHLGAARVPWPWSRRSATGSSASSSSCPPSTWSTAPPTPTSTPTYRPRRC